MSSCQQRNLILPVGWRCHVEAWSACGGQCQYLWRWLGIRYMYIIFAARENTLSPGVCLRVLFSAASDRTPMHICKHAYTCTRVHIYMYTHSTPVAPGTLTICIQQKCRSEGQLCSLVRISTSGAAHACQHLVLPIYTAQS